MNKHLLHYKKLFRNSVLHVHQNKKLPICYNFDIGLFCPTQCSH